MFKAISLFLIAVASFSHIPAHAQRSTWNMLSGNDALSTCEAIENMDDENLTPAFVCLSWVNGAVQGAKGTFSGNPEKPQYCTPQSGGTNGQFTAIFLKFLRANPEKLHLPAIYLFHQAMAKAFPCK